ncbi:hypothetical protein [Algibacter luteus]|nr:hypothetical protein [Algibacter luteus]WJJ95926.1 hypothetical protein O5O44_11910 [Algibacter luteus]
MNEKRDPCGSLPDGRQAPKYKKRNPKLDYAFLNIYKSEELISLKI